MKFHDLSNARINTGRLLILAMAMGCWSASTSAEVLGLAVYGDSLSDEYQYQTYNYARNWVEQLAVGRGVNLGPTGNWGEPRRSGYAYNWARVGARSSDLLTAQLLYPAWDDALQSGDASHAVLMIGANDFFPSFGTAYDRIYRNDWSSMQIDNSINSFIDRIQLLVDSIKATGRPLVLATPSDYGIAPFTRSTYPDAGRREAVSNVLATIVNRLDDLAQSEQIVFVNVYQLARDTFGSNLSPNSSLVVGGQNINLLTGGVSPTNAFVADGIHPHTAIQGLLANLMMTALNEYDAGLTLFSEEEISQAAGFSYQGDTLHIDYSRYVQSYVVPEASSLVLLTIFAAAISLKMLVARASRLDAPPTHEDRMTP